MAISYLRKLSTLYFFLFVGSVFAQKSIEITYHTSKNQIKKKPYGTLIFKENITYIFNINSKNLEFIDYKIGAVVSILKYDGKYYKTVDKFKTLPQPIYTNTAEKILGYDCKKSIFKAFSNTIEVWYTNKIKAKGSLYKRYLPKNGLVLKIKVNGSLRLIATEIHKTSKKISLFYPFDKAIEISKSQMRELQIKSRYIKLSVFEKQQINFDTTLPKIILDKSNKTYRCSNGTVILKKIKLPEIAKKGASIFAKITNWSNGDAYDRTCSLFTISSQEGKTVLDVLQNGLQELPIFKANDGKKYQGIISTNNYEVPVELMRFFTSFGVSYFNNKRKINNYIWQDSVVYTQEITSLISNTEDEIWLGVFIGNYDKGGHKISLDLSFYPSQEKEKHQKEKYIKPLFSTVNILEMSGQNYGRLFKTDTLSTTFEIPQKIKNLKLLYTSTGHGGWGGGDEFNQRLNKIFMDDRLIFSEVPWRTDCATYRLSNPASGNFHNGLSSSDLSRSNWCPATLTPPKVIPLTFLKPGKHTIKVVIKQGDDDGNNFNHWGVTGVLTGQRLSKDRE